MIDNLKASTYYIICVETQNLSKHLTKANFVSSYNLIKRLSAGKDYFLNDKNSKIIMLSTFLYRKTWESTHLVLIA